MALLFTHLLWWFWSGKHKEPKISYRSSPDRGLKEEDTPKLPLVNVGNMVPSSRRVEHKWNTREEVKVDREYEAVLVPSDGGCVSGYESDDSDWSVGWLEPHGPGFKVEGDTDNSFSVLVRCYGHDRVDIVEDSKKMNFSTIGNIQNRHFDENKKTLEQWLSSLQKH